MHAVPSCLVSHPRPFPQFPPPAGLRLYKGVVIFAKEHLARLFAGAKAIDMDLGATRAEVLQMVHAVADANGMTDGVHIRLMVTRGLKATPYQSPKASVGQVGSGAFRRSCGIVRPARVRDIWPPRR